MELLCPEDGLLVYWDAFVFVDKEIVSVITLVIYKLDNEDRRAYH